MGWGGRAWGRAVGLSSAGVSPSWLCSEHPCGAQCQCALPSTLVCRSVHDHCAFRPARSAGAVVMGPLVLLPSVHLGLSGGFVFTGEVSGEAVRATRATKRLRMQV